MLRLCDANAVRYIVSSPTLATNQYYNMPPLWFNKRRRKLLDGNQNSSMALTAADSRRQADHIDWLSNAVFAAEVASNVGDMLPFNYLKGAAGLVLTLLKPVQVC